MPLLLIFSAMEPTTNQTFHMSCNSKSYLVFYVWSKHQIPYQKDSPLQISQSFELKVEDPTTNTQSHNRCCLLGQVDGHIIGPAVHVPIYVALAKAACVPLHGKDCSLHASAFCTACTSATHACRMANEAPTGQAPACQKVQSWFFVIFDHI